MLAVIDTRILTSTSIAFSLCLFFFSELSLRSFSWSTAANEFHLLADEEKLPPYYRAKHRPHLVVDAAAHTISSTTVAQLRYTRLTIVQTGGGLNGGAVIEEEKTGLIGASVKVRVYVQTSCILRAV